MQLRPALTAEDLAAVQAVLAECADHDHVGLPAEPLEVLLATLAPPDDVAELHQYFLAEADGRVVAAVEVLLPQHDNTDQATVDVQVLPGRRRQGHGRAALQAALDHVRQLGRTRVHVHGFAPYDGSVGPADALLASVGATPSLVEVRRLLDVHALELVVPAAPEGYRVEQWVDVAPDALVDGLARLTGRMSTDAPQGDLGTEPEVWDAARYRQTEQVALDMGRTRLFTAVVHSASGEVAGTTDIAAHASVPGTAEQWNTIVDPAHRGRRLGMVLKAHNLALLRATLPGVRWVNTWNAETNTFMVSVNDELGFVPVQRWTAWSMDL